MDWILAFHVFPTLLKHVKERKEKHGNKTIYIGYSDHVTVK